jgi:microcystin-dependent protein
MADPTTTNRSLAIPIRGSDVGTWDTPLNGNFSALDTIVGGTTTVTVSNANVTLNATQLMSGTIVVTGILTGNVVLIFPAVQGWWTIWNQTVQENFGLFVASGTATFAIGIPPGEIIDVQIAGNSPFWRSLGRIGVVEIWAGRSTLPSWVTGSTVPPYLVCDGTTYSFSTYPVLGNRLGATFGGNGVTTFGVPDLRGRIPLPPDSTGTRITVAGCGLNGNVIGAVLDAQAITLATSQIPAHTHSGTTGTESANHQHTFPFSNSGQPVTSGNGSGGQGVNTALVQTTSSENADHTHNFTTDNGTGGGLSHANVQPTQVTGIAVIRAG